MRDDKAFYYFTQINKVGVGHDMVEVPVCK
jgi:hypothetical protein